MGRARRRKASIAGFATIAALTLALGTRAAADDPQPTPERIKAAAEEFDRGRRAYLAKDFEQAAGHFENAFRDAPSIATLRLAIRARRDAKQPARAATLAAVAQDKYPSDSATAALAKETLAETSKDLSEYVIDCAQPCTIAADGRVVSQADATHHRVFLDPGGHDLGVSFPQGGSLTKHVEGKKGQTDKLAFDPPPAPTVTVTAPPPPTATTTAPPPPTPEKPLGPVVFFIAGGVTLLAGGATILSGVDTQNDPGPDAVRAGCVGQGEACPLYQDGQDKETRTNILLGVTIGLAVVTGVIGAFFTQWSSAPKARTGFIFDGRVRF